MHVALFFFHLLPDLREAALAADLITAWKLSWNPYRKFKSNNFPFILSRVCPAFSIYLAAIAAKYCGKGSRSCGKSFGKGLERVWKDLGRVWKFWKWRFCQKNISFLYFFKYLSASAAKYCRARVGIQILVASRLALASGGKASEFRTSKKLKPWF